MTLIVGVDPGVNGACGMWDTEADKLVALYPLPNVEILIGKKVRTRLDEDAVADLFATFAMMGVRMVGVENVQGANYSGKKQSASGAFTFGSTFGALRMAATMAGKLLGVKIEVAAASPAVWKLQEQVPASAVGIVAKADVEFPEFRDQFHGKKGGLKHDVADAAFITRYFAKRIWPIHDHSEGLRVMAAGIGKSTLDVPKLAKARSKRNTKPKKDAA